MKHKFRGWNHVFSFTFHQSVKRGGYIVITTLVSLLILAGCIIGCIINAIPKEEKDNKAKKTNIETVYVLDESGLVAADYHSYIDGMKKTKFTDVNFIPVTDMTIEETAVMAGKESEKAIAVHITVGEEGYLMQAVLPKDTEISVSKANKLIEVMSECFTTNKLAQIGLTTEQLVIAMSSSVTSYTEVGEESNFMVTIIKMLGPMIFGLVLYFMLLLYGQSICKEVSTEKTTKLMETLLTNVHPYALIAGKVLAITAAAIFQFLIWIVSVVLGFVIGNGIAQSMYPDYENIVITIVRFFRDNIGESALSLPAVILGIIIFCIGFLFYCVLAGLAGSMVSKPEDAAVTQSIFQFPIIISWLLCYMSSAMEKEQVLRVLRFIPFTTPFSVPIDLISGTIGIGQGLIATAILLVFSIIIIMLSARIYKGMVLYNGERVNLKTICSILKTKA